MWPGPGYHVHRHVGLKLLLDCMTKQGVQLSTNVARRFPSIVRSLFQ